MHIAGLEKKKLVQWFKSPKGNVGCQSSLTFFSSWPHTKNQQVSFCKVEFNYLRVMGHMTPNFTDQRRSMHTSAQTEWVRSLSILSKPKTFKEAVCYEMLHYESVLGSWVRKGQNGINIISLKRDEITERSTEVIPSHYKVWVYLIIMQKATRRTLTRAFRHKEQTLLTTVK